MKPGAKKTGDALILAELECLECHSQATAELSPDAFRELTSSWKLPRQCDVCRKSTPWSFAEARVEAEEQVDLWDWLTTTGEYLQSPTATPQDERRKERRVDLRVPLRLRTADGMEEEVTSEDISKSGLGFSSSRTYPISSTIQVTVQPHGTHGPQTLTAAIVRSAPLEGGQTLYGAKILSQSELAECRDGN
jgi:hypothetical protein